MTLSTAGVAQWPPSATDVGIQTVELEVSDGVGGVAVQRFSLTVRPTTSNSPPVFTTAPVLTGVAGEAYAYDAVAIDPDGDTLIYTLVTGPIDATVDGLGQVTWGPSVDGLFDFSLKVLDGRGGVATQGWSVNVGGVPSNPNAPIIVSVPNAYLLDKSEGLLQVTDRLGNSMAFEDLGRSSCGPAGSAAGTRQREPGPLPQRASE